MHNLSKYLFQWGQSATISTRKVVQGSQPVIKSFTGYPKEQHPTGGSVLVSADDKFGFQ